MKFYFGNDRKKKITDLNDIIPEIFKNFNIEKDVYLENIINIWNSIVSQTLADHSIPLRIYKGTLTIAVDHSIFANEISMMKNTIVSRINDTIKGHQIIDIKCEIKKHQWNK